ncbi:MAG: hypothetical protein JXB18_06340 [Sedimentisphaerales bacterium]|nr:hypothetical protein [Sedimentisphaerales bacterium]
MSEERLTTRQVSIMFNIKESTLRAWRRCRGYDTRYPRFHKLFTGKVYYVKTEIIEDMRGMEVEEKGAMVF